MVSIITRVCSTRWEKETMLMRVINMSACTEIKKKKKNFLESN